jgi:hypothetical protein
MHAVDLMPVVFAVGVFALCLGYLVREYILTKWS